MFNWLRNRRRRKLLAEPFPAGWMEIIKRRVPFYAYLLPAKKSQLLDDLRIFVVERLWVGCAGLEVTDEMRLTIAAQACLLTLNIEPTYHYDRIKSLLIYPGPYRHPSRNSGQGTAGEEMVILGEAWHRNPIVLAWQSVLDGAGDPHDGNNVVFHEFAHHLDGLDGSVDGTPPLESREQYRAWDAVTFAEYNRLVRAARDGTPSFLNYYGATNQAEFFAVATESFFERGPEMKHNLPELYGVLRDFYRQDTAAWPAGPVHPTPAKHRHHWHEETHNGQVNPIDNEETRALLRSIQMKAGSADGYFSLGFEYLNSQRYKEAEAAFSEAVRLNPDDEETLVQRGIARLRLGQAAAARADFDAAIALDPSDAEAYRARAEARLRLQDYSGALDDCSRVLRSERRDAMALYVRGIALARTGELSAAIRSLTSAISADPNRADFYADRSRLYEMIGSQSRAENDRIEAIRRDPALADSLRKTVKVGG